MNRFIIGSAVALAMTTTSLAAAPIHAQEGLPGFDASGSEQIWLAKGNGNGNGNGKGNGGGNKKLIKKGNAGGGNPGKGNGHASNGKGNGNGNAKPAKGNDHASNGNGNGKGNAKPAKANDHASNGNGKPDHAGGPKLEAKGNDRAAKGNDKDVKRRQIYTTADRETVVKRISSIPVPAGRDMTRVLGATALALATPQLVVGDIPDEELITYSNCPPGLAKKNPPCVPPGLARNGITYDEWASYDQDRYDSLWLDRRNQWLRSEGDIVPDPDFLLLQSDQIATLFDLEPARDGYRYALIDGMPVLLDRDDYRSLLLVNQMAQVADLMDGVPIAPTAALTQDELINLYRLPRLGSGQSYAVLNGQLVQLDDSEYELLQMLRIARAVL